MSHHSLTDMLAETAALCVAASVNGKNATNALTAANQFKLQFNEPNGVTITIEK